MFYNCRICVHSRALEKAFISVVDDIDLAVIISLLYCSVSQSAHLELSRRDALDLKVLVSERIGGQRVQDFVAKCERLCCKMWRAGP